MMRPNLRARMPSITCRVMLNSEPRLVPITAFHCSGVMRWNMVSRVMPALLTSTSIGPSSASTCLMPAAQASKFDHVPLEHRDAGFRLELLRGLVVAGIAGGDLVARGLQRLADRLADPARSARDQRHPSHTFPLFSSG